MKNKFIAIIPARGGSKRLPGKNIRDLCGKPLIAWTIESAMKSNYIDKTIVSTDNEQIAKISRDFGAEVPFLRPKELATDNSSPIEAIIHALEFLENEGEKYDIVVLLEPTSPLRKENDIDRALKLFFENINHYTSLISVGKVRLENPFIMKRIDSGFVESLIGIGCYETQPKAYFPYGVIYLSKITTLYKYKTFYQEKSLPYLIERWQNYEIDDKCDFLCIEAILKQIIKN